MAKTWRGLLSHVLVWAATVALSSCSDVGKAHRVDTGSDPQYQDDEVRFRTTYYLRVFDLCPVDQGRVDQANYKPIMKAFTARKSGRLELVRDSLLRFRMTGQASALYSNLHFESGVLRADEVDPFGKTVDYDEARKKFIVANSSLQRLVPIEKRTDQSSDTCPSGDPLNTQFYLLGPEGVRKLDRNERLVMAMYTDAKPLIASLKHLAGQRGNDEAKTSYPFDRELSRARADEGLAMLKKTEEDPEKFPSPETLANRLLSLFGREGKPLTAAPHLGNVEGVEGTLPNEQDGVNRK